MPKAGFFRKLGLFVAEEFLEAQACIELRSDIAASQVVKGTVLGDDDQAGGVVDETVRVVSRAHVTAAIRRSLKSRLKALSPELEKHFGVSLNDFEGLEFLVYGPGSFYTPHLDASPDASTESRRVSVVVFLNTESEKPAPDCYCGGSLTFHGLMDGLFEKCAFSLQADTGLLIAFHSSALHEVKPVTTGQRYSIVGWFTGD
jgi:predicted 2-oxoglutarate/Fe(II)-dependent dioxygenase YbiX